ncbi:MAG: zinc ABC transporter substrate-binding protein [Oscillospiraceae bacterium]|nr:zinc ABC transporter substrate-binding protein [Oscillospiraceae bacterium]
MQSFKKQKINNFGVGFLFILCFCAFSLLLSSCVSNFGFEKINNEQEQKIRIIATLFPQYDFAKKIFKDKAQVTLLLPPGTESHSFDPSPSDIKKVYSCDFFIYTGKHMEPWSEKIVSSLKNTKTKSIDVSKGIEFRKNCKECNQNNKAHSHSHAECHNYDPHIWLDPTLAVKIVDNILEKAIENKPQYESFFIENAEELKKELASIDEEFESLFCKAKEKKIVFVGRFAHYYFVNRYQIEYKSAFKGCFAGAEPSSKKLLKIINYVKENKLSCIYYEELNEPKIAKYISEQTGAELLRFSTCHNLTKEEFENEITYLDIMKQNMQNLKKGLKF